MQFLTSLRESSKLLFGLLRLKRSQVRVSAVPLSGNSWQVVRTHVPLPPSIFTGRCYASAVLAMALCPSVCPSVCLSQVGVLLV